MALTVTNSDDTQTSTTGTYSLQQPSNISQAPASNAPTVSQADQDKLMSLLNSEADNSQATTSHKNNHFVEILLITTLVAIAIVLLFVYQRLAVKFLNNKTLHVKH